MNTLVLAACLAAFALVFVYIGWYAFKEANPRDGRFSFVLAGLTGALAAATGWLAVG